MQRAGPSCGYNFPNLRQHRECIRDLCAQRARANPRARWQPRLLDAAAVLRYAFAMTTLPGRAPHLRPVLDSLVRQDPIPPALISIALEPRLRGAPVNTSRVAQQCRRAAALAGARLHVTLLTREWGAAAKMLAAFAASAADRALDAVIVCDDDVLYRPWLAQQYLRVDVRAEGRKALAVLTTVKWYPVRSNACVRMVQGSDSFWVPAPLLRPNREADFKAMLVWVQARSKVAFRSDDYWNSVFLNAPCDGWEPTVRTLGGERPYTSHPPSQRPDAGSQLHARSLHEQWVVPEQLIDRHHPTLERIACRSRRNESARRSTSAVEPPSERE